LISSKHKGIRSQTARVEAEHPTYLHELYQYATAILGNVATFAELAAQMNLLSAVDKRPIMNLNKWSLLRWFKKNKGKEKRAVFRPLLTEEHKANRIQHQKKTKHLPQAEFKAEATDRIRVRRVISRSHPVKTMFMGVINQPNPEYYPVGTVIEREVNCNSQFLL